MTLTPVKRTYRVEFSSHVRTCIEGAIKGLYSCYGWHDLLHHPHSDEQFMKLDPASNGYIQAMRIYEEKYDRLVKREKSKIYKEKNINGTELRHKITYLENRYEDEKARANRALTKAEAKKIRKEKDGMLETQAKLKELRELKYSIDDSAYSIAHKKMGDYPSADTYWQPIFDRMYWEFEYVSIDIPCWIKERDYCIVSEQKITPVENVIKLERVEPKGSGVNWKSRNRGGGVRISSSGFANRATKIYPPHLPNTP